ERSRGVDKVRRRPRGGGQKTIARKRNRSFHSHVELSLKFHDHGTRKFTNFILPQNREKYSSPTLTSYGRAPPYLFDGVSCQSYRSMDADFSLRNESQDLVDL